MTAFNLAAAARMLENCTAASPAFARHDPATQVTLPRREQHRPAQPFVTRGWRMSESDGLNGQWFVTYSGSSFVALGGCLVFVDHQTGDVPTIGK